MLCSLKWHNAGSVESRDVFGNRTVCVISAQPVDEGPFHRHYGLIFRIKLNRMFNLTCPRSEKSLMINKDEEN